MTGLKRGRAGGPKAGFEGLILPEVIEAILCSRVELYNVHYYFDRCLHGASWNIFIFSVIVMSSCKYVRGWHAHIG